MLLTNLNPFLQTEHTSPKQVTQLFGHLLQVSTPLFKVESNPYPHLRHSNTFNGLQLAQPATHFTHVFVTLL